LSAKCAIAKPSNRLEASVNRPPGLSTLHTIDPSKTVERIIGAFPMEDQQGMLNPLSKSSVTSFLSVLLPRATATAASRHRNSQSTLRTREYVEKGDGGG